MVVVNGNSYAHFDLLLGLPGVSKMAFLDPPSTRPKQSQNVISEADNQVVDCKLSVLNYSNAFSAVDALVYALFEPERLPLVETKCVSLWQFIWFIGGIHYAN
jgi:hypothetical protein